MIKHPNIARVAKAILAGIVACMVCPTVTLASEAEWKVLNQRAITHVASKQYEAALPLAETALSQAETEFGFKDQRTIGSLSLLLQIYMFTNQHEKAQILQRRFLAAGKQDPFNLSGQQDQIPEPTESLRRNNSRSSSRKSLLALAEQYRAMGAHAQADALLSQIGEGKQEPQGASSSPQSMAMDKTTSKDSLREYQERDRQKARKAADLLDLLADMEQKSKDGQPIDPKQMKQLIEGMGDVSPSYGQEFKDALDTKIKPTITQGLDLGEMKPEEMQLKAIEQTQKLTQDFPEIPAILESMAPNYEVQKLLVQGRYLEALPIAEGVPSEVEARGKRKQGPALGRSRDLVTIYTRLALFDKAEAEIKRSSEEYAKAITEMNASAERMQSSHASRGRAKDKAIPFPKEFFTAMAQSGYRDNLADLYTRMGRFNEAAQVYREAQVYLPHTGDAKNILAGITLIKLGEVLRTMGEYEEAKKVNRQALEATEAYLKEAQSSESSLTNVSEMLQAIGMDVTTKELLKHDSETYKARDQLTRVMILEKQAELHRALGQYHQARQALKEALAIWETAKLPNDNEKIYFFVKLAEVIETLGDTREASKYYAGAHDLMKQLNQEFHVDRVFVHLNRARVYERQGAYTSANDAYAKALKIQRKALGTNHPETIETLTGLARVSDQRGNYAESKEQLKKALSVAREHDGRMHRQHPLTADALTAFGNHYVEQQQFTQALRYFDEALAVRRKVFKPLHLDIANSLLTLGKAHERNGNYQKALPLYEEALRIREQVLGREHPDTAAIQVDLAGLHRQQGSFVQGEALVQQALLSFKKHLPDPHPRLAAAFVEQAKIELLRNRYREGLAILRKAVEIENMVLHGQLGVMRETQQLAVIQQFNYTRDLVIELVERNFREDSEALQFGFEVTLARKSLAFDDQARLQEALAFELDASIRNAWMDRKKSWAGLMSHAPAGMSPDEVKKEQIAAQVALETMEAEMAAKSAAFSQQLKQSRANASDVASRLPTGTVFVEFVKHSQLDWKTLKETEVTSYSAFIVRKDQRVKLISFGEAQELDPKIVMFLNKLGREKDYVPSASLDPAEWLYRRLWEPIRTASGNASRLVISPDGQLNLVPFGALHNQTDKSFVIENSTIVYVTSGRDLMRNFEPSKEQAHTVIFANPNYHRKPRINSSSTTGLTILPSKGCEGRYGTFPCLPYTHEEAEAVSAIIPGPKTTYEGDSAHKEAALATRRPRVLHFAVHGYFQKGGKLDTSLLRSGLALAGANHAEDAPNSIDGRLTAFEVSGMDLHGTELVVLSACETGTGEVQDGDGVFGLRRSFALAGTKHLVMTLWRVGDKEATAQMRAFYTEYVKQGKSPDEALRDAQLMTIARLRKEQGIAYPRFWAPFIVQGAPNWTPQAKN